jgi:hypothetical protein
MREHAPRTLNQSRTHIADRRTIYGNMRIFIHRKTKQEEYIRDTFKKRGKFAAALFGIFPVKMQLYG